MLFDLCVITIFMLPTTGEQCLLVDEELFDVVEELRATSRETEDAVEHTSEPSKGVPEEPHDEVAVLHSHVGHPRNIWDDLADCESGNWLSGGGFEQGSARWHWAKPGTEIPPWGTAIHHGGLQFYPSTWDWIAPMVGLGHLDFAYDATREQQIMVAEELKRHQGPGAWSTCGPMVELR